jgi:archaellum biogenesis ATPase FlaH
MRDKEKEGMRITKELEGLRDHHSLLIISPIEELQDNINTIIEFFEKKKRLPGIYVSFNRPQRGIRKSLENAGIPVDKIFFIDCISKSLLGETEEIKNVLHIYRPTNLTVLNMAINKFVEEIPGEKYLIIDALTTLFVYNKEKDVIEFIRSQIEKASEEKVELIALIPKTKGEELMDKISVFFEKVIKL